MSSKIDTAEEKKESEEKKEVPEDDRKRKPNELLKEQINQLKLQNESLKTSLANTSNKATNSHLYLAATGGIIIGLIGAASIGYYIYSNYYSEPAITVQNRSLIENKNKLQIKNESLQATVSVLKDKIEVYKQNNFRDRDGKIEALEELNNKYCDEIIFAKSKVRDLKLKNAMYLDTINAQKQNVNKANSLKQETEFLNNALNDERTRSQTLEIQCDGLREKLNLYTSNEEDWKYKTEEILNKKNAIELKNKELSIELRSEQNKLSIALEKNNKLEQSKKGGWTAWIWSGFPWFMLATIAINEGERRDTLQIIARVTLGIKATEMIIKWLYILSKKNNDKTNV